MNIGIIIDFEVSPNNGGGYSYISLFVNKLLSSKSKHTFILVSPHSKERLRQTYVIPEELKWVDLSKIETRKLRLMSGVIKLCKKLKLFSSLVVFLDQRQKAFYHRAFKKTGIQTFFYLPYNKVYTLDIPFFFNLWDIGHRNINVFPEVSNDGQFLYREGLCQEILPRAYKIIAETEAGKRDVEFYYRIKPEKIVVGPMFAGEVIHQAYSREESAEWMEKNGLKKDQFMFYPAQFWAHKNHINLLHAFKKVSAQNAELKLVLCGGDKGNLDFVKTGVKELGLEDRVVILGFVNNLKIIRILYEEALALVMPTFLGPSNMPILEAMALGCPVVCSDFEGHRELGGNHLLYVRPNAPESIAEAVLHLWNHPEERKALSQGAKKYYEESENHVEKTIDVVLSEFDEFETTRRCWE